MNTRYALHGFLSVLFGWLLLSNIYRPQYLPDPAKSQFVPGQSWSYRSRPGEENSRVVVLSVEAVGGTLVVHVRVEGLKRIARSESDQITDTIPHAALFEHQLKSSVIELVETRQPQPPMPPEYIRWKEREPSSSHVYTGGVAEMITWTEEVARQKAPKHSGPAAISK